MHLTSKRSIRHILVPLGAGLVLSLLGDQTLYTVLPNPSIAAVAGVTLGMVGVLLGINRLTRLVFNGVAGTLYDRMPRRPLMIAGMCIGAVSTACYALAHGAAIMIVGRVLWGIAWSAIWVGSNTIALDISNDSNRGEVTGRLQMWVLTGVGVASFTGGMFTDLFGYRNGLWASAALTAIAALVWGLLLPETRPDKKTTHHIPIPAQPPRKPLPWKEALGLSVPYLALRIVFAGILASSTVLWLSQFTGPQLNFRSLVIPLATLTGGFVAVRVLISMMSAPLIGRLSDRIQRRWATMSVVLLFGTLGMVLMSLPVVLPAVLGGLIASASTAGIQTLVSSIVGDRVAPDLRSRVLGVIFTIGDLGSAVGPSVGLGLIPIIGLNAVYMGCAVVFALATVFSVWYALREVGVQPAISN
jgi:DHA1 family multidrug resistance protein-like MFS transporter